MDPAAFLYHYSVSSRTTCAQHHIGHFHKIYQGKNSIFFFLIWFTKKKKKKIKKFKAYYHPNDPLSTQSAAFRTLGGVYGHTNTLTPDIKRTFIIKLILLYTASAKNERLKRIVLDNTHWPSSESMLAHTLVKQSGYYVVR